MTLSEIAAMKKAAVIIPSPNVTDNHQYRNAKVLADANAAILIEEKDLGAKTLGDAIEKLSSDKNFFDDIRQNIASFSFKGVGEAIFNDIKDLIDKGSESKDEK